MEIMHSPLNYIKMYLVLLHLRHFHLHYHHQYSDGELGEDDTDDDNVDESDGELGEDDTDDDNVDESDGDGEEQGTFLYNLINKVDFIRKTKIFLKLLYKSVYLTVSCELQI
jgi:hypothetical protein